LPKPAPDGYNEMMKVLKVKPENTIILEDSNSGIKSATASGAFVISISENSIPGYKQIDIANAKAKSILEVIEVVKKWLAEKKN
jgi:beta-phosphoglucomutase-like phosphatase (HAD superfamily)